MAELRPIPFMPSEGIATPQWVEALTRALTDWGSVFEDKVFTLNSIAGKPTGPPTNDPTAFATGDNRPLSVAGVAPDGEIIISGSTAIVEFVWAYTQGVLLADGFEIKFLSDSVLETRNLFSSDAVSAWAVISNTTDMGATIRAFRITSLGMEYGNPVTGLFSIIGTSISGAGYALLVGRTTGQKIQGGTASGENLSLESTANATKGRINLGATSYFDEVPKRLREIGVSEVQSGEPSSPPTGMVLLDTAVSGIGSVLGIVSKVTTYTATLADDVILCDASGGAFSVFLPLAADQTGKIFHIKKIDASGNAVTVDGNGSETIDDATTQAIVSQYDSMMVVSNSSAWFIL